MLLRFGAEKRRFWMKETDESALYLGHLGPRTRFVTPFGSASNTLHDLADLIFHYDWLSLLNEKAPRSHEDTEL